MLDTRSFEDSVQQKKSMVPIQQGESISDALELYNQNTVKRRKDLYRRSRQAARSLAPFPDAQTPSPEVVLQTLNDSMEL